MNLYTEDQHYSPQKLQEPIMINVSPNTRNVSSSFEDTFKPKLHLLVKVKLLQVIDNAQRIHTAC